MGLMREAALPLARVVRRRGQTVREFLIHVPRPLRVDKARNIGAVTAVAFSVLDLLILHLLLRGAALRGALLTAVLLVRMVVDVVLVADHELARQSLRILSVVAALVWDDIWWACIFELISDLVEVRQERVIPGLPGRRRGHSFEWEAQ